MTWVRKWDVPSRSEAGKFYVVAVDELGNYGCSCPAWKYRRKVCSHISRIARQEDVMRNMEIIPEKGKDGEKVVRMQVSGAVMNESSKRQIRDPRSLKLRDTFVPCEVIRKFDFTL